ncbi:MAG: SUF system NifU family Fe-S cluster assembly protein [Chloroflexi bacterium]|nr:SUF system NifU family Fe-S cluster assembly protein [Chloroflexota bacterium]MCH8869309.1 SUF system NifU family Fe-S cluster assembly protein [Chloroflexota bacterium]MCI0771222.1 SUF system NifU family Fe-S cluster assembly protein [Chloroflexota bacterium]MCI0790778.1 SUF system NifU family Fe-S cluster assembly protein [Chloroflexota bacterium]MCI0795732.1 SUF system NifU family Fe-S cluster assembly protein [Chloroflexota bacterium]
MYDIQELYQEVLMDHNRRPRNFRKPDDANRSAEGFNPLCGDEVTLYLEVDDDDNIKDVGFQAVGCAISKASASMMTEAVKGLSVKDAENVFDNFRQMITKQDYDADLLGDGEILSGVTQYPARIKCAVLSWHTLKAALNGADDKRVTTE